MEVGRRHRRIILCGKAASGKDYLKRKWQQRGFSCLPSYTTRPKRDGEEEGVDYHFMDTITFEKLMQDDFFYETVTFNGWSYGTSKDQFHKTSDLFIMTPSGLAKVKPQDRQNSLVIYLDIPFLTRKSRLLLRNDNHDSAFKRLQADEEEFKDFQDFDLRLSNADF
jgi:guanylate kinase